MSFISKWLNEREKAVDSHSPFPYMCHPSLLVGEWGQSRNDNTIIGYKAGVDFAGSTVREEPEPDTIECLFCGALHPAGTLKCWDGTSGCQHSL